MADSTRMDDGATATGGGAGRATSEPDIDVDVAAFERVEAELEEAEVGERTEPRERSEAREPEAAQRPESGVCPVGFCPIGMALSMVQGTKPDAVEHLLVAGREFLLAARSVLDARAEDAGGSSTLKKIEID